MIFHTSIRKLVPIPCFVTEAHNLQCDTDIVDYQKALSCKSGAI